MARHRDYVSVKCLFDRLLIADARIEKAGKVTVQPLVPGNELVRECQTGHNSSLPQPEDGAKAVQQEKIQFSSFSQTAIKQRC